MRIKLRTDAYRECGKCKLENREMLGQNFECKDVRLAEISARVLVYTKKILLIHQSTYESLFDYIFCLLDESCSLTSYTRCSFRDDQQW